MVALVIIVKDDFAVAGIGLNITHGKLAPDKTRAPSARSAQPRTNQEQCHYPRG
jgi:hypothetical protein